MAHENRPPKPPRPAAGGDDYRPYIPDEQVIPEFTWQAVIVGSLLGIVFGASSLYLVLKVGLTVSASIPVAVLSITLFRLFSRITGLRRATILENNITQTAGSAGESIAFGVGVTMPALLLLGFDLDVVRVMTVGALGGLLGILMMIPLRRAFIVKQHKELKYPEGTACAEVLIVGEKGGASAATVFGGFGLAFLYKLLCVGLGFWPAALHQKLSTASGRGLKGGVLSGEISPELLGVGYIIGPKIASIMLGGGVLAYLVLTPLIVLLGENLETPIAPATELIREMDPGAIRSNYILYIGAGAVATGGIVSMFQALPMILASIAAGLRDLRGSRGTGGEVKRTSRDLSMLFVLVGALGLVVALAALPNLGLGFNWHGLLGASLIVVFGFLFVTVSARLTGQIGSSSNPISGMTVATLLLTCLVFLALGKIDKASTLTALTIAAVVCIAASNGGTTAQDLKTGYLVGATPRWQQLAILIGALSSALVIGVTLLLLNEAGTVYTTKPQFLPDYRVPDVTGLPRAQVGGEYAAQDTTLYYVLNVSGTEIEGVRQGKYLVDESGTIVYYVDPAINGVLKERDDGTAVPGKFDAPKTRLMALIIDGILNQKLPWELVLIGALIALTLELAGVPSLPFAVGVYLPLETSMPIFLGGGLRWIVDLLTRKKESDSDASPGVLLSSGYIAGGAIAGVVVAFFTFLPDDAQEKLRELADRAAEFHATHHPGADLFALAAFGVLL
ncbi:MAG: oligopeptide transporter, OPT family, partial [Planctomycetaceae bacterium]|nr:oligopeptide transporter, OPT family [Planctomycetaceae bacterium]